jgi:hypothetical protein
MRSVSVANQVEQGIKLPVPELYEQSRMHAMQVGLAQVFKAERGVGQDNLGVVFDVGIQSTRGEVSRGLQQLLLVDSCHTADDNDRVERLQPVAPCCRPIRVPGQLIRWESDCGWTRRGYGQVAEKRRPGRSACPAADSRERAVSCGICCSSSRPGRMIDTPDVLVLRGLGRSPVRAADRDLRPSAVGAVAAHVEPQVAGEGEDALRGLPVEFGCVLGGV